jgi:hypothetical protein
MSGDGAPGLHEWDHWRAQTLAAGQHKALWWQVKFARLKIKFQNMNMHVTHIF